MKTLIPFLLLCFLHLPYPQNNGIKEDYVVSIKKGKLKTVDNEAFLEVPVSLTNNTKDTLYYLTMTCSWQDFYYIDNERLKGEEVPCDKNIFDLLKLAPGKTNTVALKLFYKNPTDSDPVTFKIGHNIVKVDDEFKRVKSYRELRKKKNIIWSNAVTFKNKSK